jgi:hypothetical protein
MRWLTLSVAVASSAASLAASRRGRDLAGSSYGAFALWLISLTAFLQLPALAEGEAPVASLHEFHAPEARQAVATDAEYFYVIGNRTVAKYDKQSGERVSRWEGPENGPIVHLNSGVVVDGRLYCGHSNYPSIPMTSSVEIWDTETLEHVSSHSFGLVGGSLTWVDWRDGYWWAGFAMYTGEKAEPGKDPSWTAVVQYDRSWQRHQSWVFPPEVVAKFQPMSNSGGSWGPDGSLYCTGHNRYEVYAMRLPQAGSTLELVRTVPVASFGQGISFDRTPGREWDLWGIGKQRGVVRATRLTPAGLP